MAGFVLDFLTKSSHDVIKRKHSRVGIHNEIACPCLQLTVVAYTHSSIELIWLGYLSLRPTNELTILSEVLLCWFVPTQHMDLVWWIAGFLIKFGWTHFRRLVALMLALPLLLAKSIQCLQGPVNLGQSCRDWMDPITLEPSSSVTSTANITTWIKSQNRLHAQVHWAELGRKEFWNCSKCCPCYSLNKGMTLYWRFDTCTTNNNCQCCNIGKWR